MLSPLCDLVPDYAVGIITELVQADLPDCMVAALRALHHTVTGTLSAADMAALLHPHQASTTDAPGVPPAVPGYGSTAASASAGISPANAIMLQELMRRGLHPIDVLGVGHMTSRLTAALSRVWQQWHMLYGTNAGELSDGGHCRWDTCCYRDCCSCCCPWFSLCIYGFPAINRTRDWCLEHTSCIPEASVRQGSGGIPYTMCLFPASVCLPEPLRACTSAVIPICKKHIHVMGRSGRSPSRAVYQDIQQAPTEYATSGPPPLQRTPTRTSPTRTSRAWSPCLGHSCACQP
jgi:hypothetical protein